MLISKFFDLLASKIRSNTALEQSPVLPDLAGKEARQPVVPESVRPDEVAEEDVSETDVEYNVEVIRGRVAKLSKRPRRAHQMRVDDEGWTRSERRDERRRQRVNKDASRLSKAERRALVELGLSCDF